MNPGTRLVLLLLAGLWLPIGLRTGLDAAAASHLAPASAAGVSTSLVAVLSYAAVWLLAFLASFLPSRRLSLIVGVAIVLAPLYGAVRWVNVHDLPGRDDPVTLLGNLGILLILLLAALLLGLLTRGLGAILDSRLPHAGGGPGRAGRILASVVLCLAVWSFFFFLWPASRAANPARGSASGADEAARPEPSPAKRRVCLVGIDGATWSVILPLIARGDLPTFSRLMRDGQFGTLATLQTWSASPALWTSIATGTRPERHGIDFFVATLYRPPAADAWLHLPDSWSAPVVARGFDALSAVKLAGRRKVPVNGSMRREPALWEILTESGRRSLVVNWWASWPADPVDGVLVSDMADLLFAKHFGIAEENEGYQYLENVPRVVHPPERRAEVIATLRDVEGRADDWKRWLPGAGASTSQGAPRLDPQDPASYFRLGFLSDEATMRTAEHFLRAPDGGDYDFMALYFRGLDWVEHYLWDSLEPEFFPQDLPGVTNTALRDAVPNYYRYVDTLLARVLGAIDDRTVLLVVSDHGHRRAEPYGSDGDHRGTHDSWPRPDGIFLACGPGVRANNRVTVVDAGLLDIAPTVLTLLDVPWPETMQGKPLAEVLGPRELALHPPARTPAYHRLAAQETHGGPSEGVDREAVERLRSLGYL